MNRDNLKARLENIRKLDLEERVKAYEKLFEEVDIQPSEEFVSKNGEESNEIEVKRRVWITYKIAESLDLKDLQSRIKTLLKENF